MPNSSYNLTPFLLRKSLLPTVHNRILPPGLCQETLLSDLTFLEPSQAWAEAPWLAPLATMFPFSSPQWLKLSYLLANLLMYTFTMDPIQGFNADSQLLVRIKGHPAHALRTILRCAWAQS